VSNVYNFVNDVSEELCTLFFVGLWLIISGETWSRRCIWFRHWIF